MPLCQLVLYSILYMYIPIVWYCILNCMNCVKFIVNATWQLSIKKKDSNGAHVLQLYHRITTIIAKYCTLVGHMTSSCIVNCFLINKLWVVFFLLYQPHLSYVFKCIKEMFPLVINEHFLSRKKSNLSGYTVYRLLSKS